jgi:hypothetical protein
MLMENNSRELLHYARLVAKKHFILQYQSFHMEMKYLRHLGVGDYQVFYTRLSALYLKRKIQLFRTLRLPQYKQDKTVQGILQEEFRSWQEELKRQHRRLVKAQTYADHCLYKHHRVKKIYPLLIQGVLHFHPELEFARKIPANTEGWQLILDSFYQGHERRMSQQIGQNPTPIWSWNDIRKVILEEKSKALLRDLRDIRSEGFFRWRERLMDRDWVQNEQQKLQDQVQDWEAKREKYYQQLLNLTKLKKT